MQLESSELPAGPGPGIQSYTLTLSGGSLSGDGGGPGAAGPKGI